MKKTLLLFVTILLLSPFTQGQQVNNLPEQKDEIDFYKEQEKIRYEREKQERERIKEEILSRECEAYEQRRKERMKNSKGGEGYVTESDSLALVAFYNATDGDNWTNNESWLTGNVNSWYGISVEEGRVTRIILEDNNLTGSIFDEIENLSALITLSFYENNNLSINLKEICKIVNLGIMDKKEAVFNTILSSGQKGGCFFM